MTLDIPKILSLLEQDGLFCQRLPGFEARSQQVEMMKSILDAYNEGQIALIEAGTGTGKSFAYLIPAILAAVQNGERTVISTNTINLQEQLVQKDIPLVSKILNTEVEAVLVKGMGNYVCLRKVDESKDFFRLLTSDEQTEFEKIEKWAWTTPDGSRASLPLIPSSQMWQSVMAEHDTCTGNECPYFKECHFFKARKKAADAHLLVVNHHLLCADLVRRQLEGNYKDPSVLPSYSNVILDEAHHLEDVATNYFATRVGKLEMLHILSKIASDKQGKLPLLSQKLDQYYKGAPPAFLASIYTRLNFDIPGIRNEVSDSLHEAFQTFSLFGPILQKNSSASTESKLRLLPMHYDHPYWKEETFPRAKKMVEATKKYAAALIGICTDIKAIDHEKLQEISSGTRSDLESFSRRLEEMCLNIEHFISSDPYPNKVRWIESSLHKQGTNTQLVNADLDISQALIKALFQPFKTIILCSATLTTSKSFRFLRKRLGLLSEPLIQKTITESLLDSPFNYQEQALLAIPTDMPNPSDASFTKVATDRIWDSIQASKGHVFILFTAYGMLQECVQLLQERLTSGGYTLIKQGEGTRNAILAKFKTAYRPVLFATDSFWEGVDVAGDALRCVILVKLPFKVPSDPMVQARTEAISLEGGDAFIDFSVPSAIVKFKQGFGRLIRNKTDRGCIVCLDNRLITKGYGQLFLNSLPACRQLFAPSDLLKTQMALFYQNSKK